MRTFRKPDQFLPKNKWAQIFCQVNALFSEYTPKICCHEDHLEAFLASDHLPEIRNPSSCSVIERGDYVFNSMPCGESLWNNNFPFNIGTTMECGLLFEIWMDNILNSTFFRNWIFHRSATDNRLGARLFLDKTTHGLRQHRCSNLGPRNMQRIDIFEVMLLLCERRNEIFIFLTSFR